MTFLYWFLCFLIGLLPAWLVYRSDKKKNIQVKWLPALLRFIVCFFTAALLLAPAFPTTKTEEEKPLVLWLQDNSTSIKGALGKDSADYKKKVAAIWDKWKDDYKLIPITFGTALSKDSLFNYTERSTNIANALQAATEQYRDQNLGAVILSSDGIFNEGQDPLYTPLGNALPVFTIALGDSTQPKDVMVSRVYANKTIALNSNFEILIDVRADKLAGINAALNIINNGNSIASNTIRIDKDQYTASLRFEVKATVKGFQRYTVSIPKVDGEVNETNNKMDFFVEVVDEKSKVLLLAAAPHPDIAAIREALESVPQYQVEVVFGNNAPANLNAYALVIAHQVPAITGAQLTASNTPTWFILGRQSNLNAFNQQQALLKITGSGNANDALPLLNNNFSFFTLPANVREVMAKMPPLQAPYGNYAASAEGQVLMHQQIGSVATNYPLWIIKNGTVPQAILCGEGLWRWRLYEYKNFKNHNIVDELIRQTVSLLSVQKDARPFKVFMDKYIFTDNEVVNLYAELRNDNGELINTPAATVVVTDSTGKKLNYNLEKSGNSYRLNLGLLSAGNYTFAGSTNYNGKSYASEGAFVIESVPLEQLRTNADYALMNKLAQQTGGSFFTYSTMHALVDSVKNNSSVKPIIHTDKTFTQLIDKRWFFFLILLFAAAEWLLRKYWNT